MTWTGPGGSITLGPPEHFLTPGVETTTGALQLVLLLPEASFALLAEPGLLVIRVGAAAIVDTATIGAAATSYSLHNHKASTQVKDGRGFRIQRIGLR